PNDIVAVGDLVKVKVLEVDAGRKRISVTRKF
ncbi:MAG: S1 RNA-binding domain-containing protein, partial [Deltaproteobacteria bacterium]|nr:S1 RNA-binding domain-containing protein [Deltaproteobacteria bacterium]